MTKSGKVRWGILGTAQIARKNWQAIQRTGNATVVAVASRDADRSRQFIRDCQADAPMEDPLEALGSYEELLASANVDAVYIPLPTGLRKEWVLRAAAAGKHIVCEKPCAVTVADLWEMLEACQRHRVQFMDGVMFMHSRRLDGIREVLDDGQSVGQVRRITSAFSYCAAPEFFTSNIRARSNLEPQGCLGDLGWYCIRFALWTMNWQMPQRVTGRILSEHRQSDSPTPVPTEFSGELLFADGVSAGFYCSFVAENQQWAHISGAKGCLRMDDFVLPFDGNEVSFEVQRLNVSASGGTFRLQPSPRRLSVPEHSQSHATAQETNLFRNFSNQVQSGQLNALWPDIALKTQTVLCACLDSARNDGQPMRLR